MKKVLFLLLFVLLFTGCDIKEVNSNNLDATIDTIIKNNDLTNTVSKGYKYYLPNGVMLVSSDNYNEKLFYNNDYYYLYIDIVKYHYNTYDEKEEDDNSYYFKKLDNGKNKGYINVKKYGELYFVNALYNYSMIEAYVNEKNLNPSILNISYILSSVRLNGVVTGLLLNDKQTSGIEEKFSLYKNAGDKKSFSEYLELYDNYSEEVIIGDQNISGEIGKESE